MVQKNQNLYRLRTYSIICDNKIEIILLIDFFNSLSKYCCGTLFISVLTKFINK